MKNRRAIRPAGTAAIEVNAKSWFQLRWQQRSVLWRAISGMISHWALVIHETKLSP